jgi:Xaa-Pro dipeptidase
MAQPAEHYSDHINTLKQRADSILSILGLDGMVIHSGEPLRIFLDDQDYPFKINPHFKYWLPLVDTPHCYLVIRQGEKPELLFYRPVDYWHKVPPLPTEFWVEHWQLKVFERLGQVGDHLPDNLSRFAFIGEHVERAAELGLTQLNPKGLMDYLHFHRSIKTPYEVACIDEANRLAVAGHCAARDAFYYGGSEYSIHFSYLAAMQQCEHEMPYGNIIALNEHSAVLHYTKLERKGPEVRRSFLIDAGASHFGYAADITRTYAQDPSSLYGELIAAMTDHKLALIEGIKPGVDYVDLHVQMHKRVAHLMAACGLSKASAVDTFESGLTQAFFPHGLGHPIGLQVHDVAGFMQDEQGTEVAAPTDYPALRCTRTVEEGMVLTIEPGLYIIDSLIDGLTPKVRSLLDTRVLDELRPFGGIRVEDDIVVTSDGTENLTRKHNLD